MKKVAIKNHAVFCGGAAIVGVIAIFIFSFSFAFAAPQAHAYAVGSVPSTSANFGYDFGGSLQNLASPFTNFIDSLKLNNNSGLSGGTSWPVVNITVTPGSSITSAIQNLLSQWLSEFDHWFYSVTGVQLSGILVAILSLFAWALGLAQQAVNWMLGLFH